MIQVLKKKFLKRLIDTSIEFLSGMAYCVVAARYVFFFSFFLLMKSLQSENSDYCGRLVTGLAGLLYTVVKIVPDQLVREKRASLIHASCY